MGAFGVFSRMCCRGERRGMPGVLLGIFSFSHSGFCGMMIGLLVLVDFECV